jgi:RsiW-degrading membrane proteinase PrsW (M82 family)
MPLFDGTPLPIVLGAVAPATCYAAALYWAQRGAGRSALVLIGCLLWGAIVAPLLSTSLNDAARVWMEVVSRVGDARQLTATVVAPVVEEIVKACGLLVLLVFRPTALASVRDGVVCGALIGIGFVLTENLTYLGFAALQGGEAGLARSIYLRGVLAGTNHAIFTATIGAGIGWTRRTPSAGVRMTTLAAAVIAALAQHVAWNGVASPAIAHLLCGAPAPAAACLPAPTPIDLFGWVPMVILLFLGPGAIALLFLTSRPPAERT